MASNIAVCACLVLWTISVFGGNAMLRGGLYCKDPDVGVFYPVNSTWPSTTFCGNYTCKARKKNVSLAKTENITVVNVTHAIPMDSIESDMTHAGSDPRVVISNPNTNLHPKFNKQIPKVSKFVNVGANKNALFENLQETLLHSITDKEDRYLTENEIKTITELLHTVKKSDLEAIVEIYSLAKDILQEIDVNGIDQSNLSALSHKNFLQKSKAKLSKNNDIPKPPLSTASYFYEPLIRQNEKQFIDMQNEASNYNALGSTPAPFATTRSTIIPKLYHRSNAAYTSPFLINSFDKLPYYYPISDFQRMSSYVHDALKVTPKSQVSSTLASKSQKNNSCPANTVPGLNPWITREINKPYQIENQYTKPQATLLPYPFSYVYKNNKANSVFYNPWTQYDTDHPKYITTRKTPQVAAFKMPEQVLSSELAYDVDLNPLKQDINLKNIQETTSKMESTTKYTETSSWPSWQTEQLTQQTIDEVKANIRNKSDNLLNIFPLKSKMKLERVGKLIKLDELTREKRNLIAESEADYEVYIEKTTCEASLEPGYFRVGDVNQPFPACCPQKIEKQ